MSRPLRIRKANVNQPTGEGIWQCPSCRLMRVDFGVTGCQAIWSLYNLCKSIATILHWAGLHHAFPLPETVHKGQDFYFSVTKIIHWTNQWVNKSSNQTTKQQIHHRCGMEKNMRGWERDQMRTIWMTFQLVLILGVLLVVAGGLGSLRASADLGFVDNVFVWLIPVITTLHIRLSDWLTDWQKGHNQTHLLQNSIKRVAHFDGIFISLILCVDLIKGSKLH